jgi:hypothetical protein
MLLRDQFLLVVVKFKTNQINQEQYLFDMELPIEFPVMIPEVQLLLAA